MLHTPSTGRWTCEEHVLFLKGLEMHGKGWKKIAKLIKTRTVVQIRTHAQKYFQKLAKAKKNGHSDFFLEGGRFSKRVSLSLASAHDMMCSCNNISCPAATIGRHDGPLIS